MEKDKIKKLLIGEFIFKRLLKSVLSVIILLYLVLLFCGFLLSDIMIFPRPNSSYADDKEIIKIETADGLRISAIHKEVDHSKYTIIYSHGNGEDLGDIKDFLDRVKGLGCSIIGYDYPGYGTSEGSPSVADTISAIEAVYGYLISKGMKPDHMIMWGRSVGGGPSTELAKRYPIAGLILESTFVSAFRVLTHYAILPIDKFKNIEKIDKINCPLMVIHGTADRTVPFWHGQALYKQAKKPKSALWVESAGHNDVDSIAGKEYWEAIGNFIGSVKRNP